METNNRFKPFCRYSFYLDLENAPQLVVQLTQYINELGGRIDQFLNEKNVKTKYIVTNRPKNVWPNKESIIKSTNNKLGFTPELDSITNSPIAKNNSNKDLFSRGKLLLSKANSDQKLVAKKTSNAVNNVLELGRLYSIKIIQANQMLDFCKKQLKSSPTLTSPPKDKSLKTQLRSPFIKVEDNLLKTKPNYKEFHEWPQINYEFHAELCPFVKKKVQKSVVEETQSLEGLAFANKFNDKLTNQLNDSKSKELSLKNPTLVKRKPSNKRRISYYCEMCLTDYDDISQSNPFITNRSEQPKVRVISVHFLKKSKGQYSAYNLIRYKRHLKSETHEKYTKNEENYRELQSVISSLPPFNVNHNSVKCMSFDNESDSSDDDEETSSPFQSTPNMSTIQLCGSTHKSHFLPIHDLFANNKSSQELETNKVNHQLETNQDSSDGIQYIPHSVSSIKATKHILNSYLNEDSSELSEEYLITK